MRDLIRSKLEEALEGEDEIRLSMLRLVNMAIADKDRVIRETRKAERMSDDAIRRILRQMIQQRRKSSINFEEHGQIDLANQERREISILEELLPTMLDEDQVRIAIEHAIHRTRARGIRDKGRVMQALKSRYPGRMDFRLVDDMVIDRLS